MLKALVLSSAALAFTVPTWANDAPATSTAAAPSPEQVVAQFRSDMQAQRADLMAKGLTLTADQAAKFWPLYEQYQKEQNVIIDGQLKAVQKYGAAYDKLTDAESLEFVNALLDRDAKMHALRIEWLKKFQTVVPPGTAARAIQLDRRLGQVGQVVVSSQIPLVH